MGLRRFLARRWWDEERKQEIAARIAIEVDDLVARGMTPEQARSAAFRKFGNPTRVREEIYLMNSFSWMESLVADLRYGMRVLRRRPRSPPLPFSRSPSASAPTQRCSSCSTLSFCAAFRSRSRRSFSKFASPLRAGDQAPSRAGALSWASLRCGNNCNRARKPSRGCLPGMRGASTSPSAAEGRYAQGLYVSGEFFNVLGVPAQQGRVFTREDDRAGCTNPGAVISHGFWQREFGGKPAVGQTLTLERQRFDIVGITPASFFGVEVGRYFDVALPICAEPLVARENSALSRAGTIGGSPPLAG